MLAKVKVGVKFVALQSVKGYTPADAWARKHDVVRARYGHHDHGVRTRDPELAVELRSSGLEFSDRL